MKGQDRSVTTTTTRKQLGIDLILNSVVKTSTILRILLALINSSKKFGIFLTPLENGQRTHLCTNFVLVICELNIYLGPSCKWQLEVSKYALLYIRGWSDTTPQTCVKTDTLLLIGLIRLFSQLLLIFDIIFKIKWIYVWCFIQ